MNFINVVSQTLTGFGLEITFFAGKSDSVRIVNVLLVHVEAGVVKGDEVTLLAREPRTTGVVDFFFVILKLSF